MRFLAIIILAMIAADSRAATWYVDKDASGSNNGTSWANAWQTFSAINWSSVSAGDTVYVSGGEYNEAVFISKSGTTNNPVRLKASQESGHNDPIVTGAIAINGNWVTVDGSKSELSSNLFLNTLAVTNLDTNINWITTGPWPGSSYYAGITIRWMTITNQNLEDYHGIRFNPDPNSLVACVVEYVHVNGVGQDAVTVLSTVPSAFDQLVIRYCHFENMADDGIECSGGVTVHNSLIHSCTFARGHPDAYQGVGNYHRIYNCIFYDFGSSLILMQGQAPEGGQYGKVQFYGNICYFKDYPYPGFNPPTTEFEFKWYPPDHTWDRTNVYYQDWVIANNTFAFLQSGGVAWEARGWGDTGGVSNIFARQILAVNNLWYMCTNNWIGVPFGTNVTGGFTNFWNWSSQDVEINYNVMATNGLNNGIGWMGTNFASGEALSQHYWKSNRSAIPTLTDPNNYDFRPVIADTVVRARGTNLAGLNLPGWDTDLFGQARGSTPSIGAAEPSNTGLVIWLKFDDDFSDDQLDDSSGNGNHAYRFGRDGSVYPTNSALRYTITNTPGRSNIAAGDYAGQFRWNTNTDYGLYHRDGSYACGTNATTAQFGTNSTLTFAVWCRYFSATNAIPGADYSVDQNACLFSMGSTATSTKGAWKIGRNGQVRSHLNETRFEVNTNTSQEQFLVNYRDGWAPINDGDSTNWHHIAFTWNNGVVITYYDGAPDQTNDLSAVITTLNLGHSNSRAVDPWSVGTDIHLGTPPLENEAGEDYPNNAFFNGVMDDLRIYNRVLSAAEVAAIALGGSVGGGGGEPDPGPPATTNSFIRMRSLRLR